MANKATHSSSLFAAANYLRARRLGASDAVRTIACLLISLVLACTLLPCLPASSAFAAETEPEQTSEASQPDQRVVKVGYMQQEGVLARNEDGTFEGYTYDYLIHIAQFTGWKYEFIEAPGANDNERAGALIDMLANGEVDIEGSMTYSQSLAEYFEYPQNSYGTAHTALFVPNTNNTITQTNLFTRDNVTVSLLASSSMRREELVYFFEQNGINLTMAYKHDSMHPWISSQISGFPQVMNVVRMPSPSREIPNRLVYERIFSAAKVVNSVVNLADLQLRTL